MHICFTSLGSGNHEDNSEAREAKNTCIETIAILGFVSLQFYN